MGETTENLKERAPAKKNHAFWRGFFDALLGPKSSISGLRRRFSYKGWRTKLSVVLLIASVLSGFATYAALQEIPPFGDDPTTVIWLLNLDLALLLTLGILLARRIANIWSGRRRNIAGSKLHVRLIVIFSIMAALPAIIMAVFSAFFFHFGVQSWFSDNVRTAVYDSQVVAEAYLEEHKQVIKADILAMANDIDRQAARMMDAEAAYDRVLDTQSLLRNLSEALIFNKSGKILSRSGLTFTLTFEKVPDYLLERADDGDVVVLTSEADDRVRALVQLNSGQDNYLFVGRQVDPTVLSYLASANDATERYKQLEKSYSGLQITVTLIFVIVALLLLMAAMWVGVVLARQLVNPISTLISVSDRVRGGDLKARVPKQEQIEEFDYLAQSFNRMTAQIQQQQDELVTTNRQLDQRRRMIETILTGVPAGVVGIDKDNKITFANTMASELFDQEKLAGQNINNLFPELSQAIDEAYLQPQKIKQVQLPFLKEGGKKAIFNIRVAIEKIGDVDYGAVLTFDDITELQAAQRKAAWADVARRIAHEIKNPLTPIQLSAERLKRKYADQIETDKEVFEICTDTIIRHVGDIGRMVNEFSDFARMPEPVMSQVDIVSEVNDLIVFQKSGHPKIKFIQESHFKKGEIKINADGLQLRQAVTNIIQNALDSIGMAIADDEISKGVIEVNLSQQNDHIKLTIKDNGKGFPESEALSDLTEPYVTHKIKGTGLGLAIVKKIMSDHDGEIILKANDGDNATGASVSLVFPMIKHSYDTIRDLKKAV